MVMSLSIDALEKVKEREQIAKECCWDVDALYASWEEWEQEMRALGNESKVPHWPRIEALKDTWRESPEGLRQLLELSLAIDRGLSKLYAYAHLRHDEDVAAEIPKRNHARISALMHDYRQETAWIEPSLLQCSHEQLIQFLQDPVLKDYVFFVEKIVRMRPHTLPAEQEELIAKAGLSLEAASRAFGALNNADLKFPAILDGQGKQRELTHGKYLVYLREKDRVLRESAFKSLHRAFLGFENTLCELLNGQVQSHVFAMKARKFTSCLEAALFPHHIDKAVYETLIHAVRNELPALHRYVSLRKKALHLDAIHLYDLHVPLAEEGEMRMPYEKAVEVIVDSLAVMGKDYQKTLKKGLTEERWVDRYENTRKRSGAYSSGCYDSKPYILMNYNGTFCDVKTLAHEAGHSMHSFLSHKHQPYQYSHYAIFVAEVASTFHEELLLRHLLKRAKTKEEKIFLINQEIDVIRGTLLRQTQFAEFELKLHTFAEQGIPLTPGLLKEEYRKLNQEYYGSEMVLDPEADIEWARIPHFYYNFYVYQYATGISAAHALAEKVIAEGEKAKDQYLSFLSAGSSKYPIDALKIAGVDMRSTDAVTHTMRHFKTCVDKLEELLRQ